MVPLPHQEGGGFVWLGPPEPIPCKSNPCSSEPMSQVTYQNIHEALQQLKLHGQMVCIHSSLKSFGKLQGGPDTLLQAFLDEENSILVPSFSYDFEVPPPADMRPRQNGYDYSKAPEPSTSPSKIYSPKCTEISGDMGAIPKALIAHQGQVRGNHPLNSFAALGPRAQELIEGQSFLDVYAPCGYLYEHGGALVLMGVGLTRATAIHYAEQRAGKHLFIRWARDHEGAIRPVKVGSCSEGFDRLDPVVAPFEQRLSVRSSEWRIYDFRTFVDAIAAAIRENPQITHCDNEHCLRCRDMVLGGVIQ